MNTYIKLFFWTAVPFGLIMTAFSGGMLGFAGENWHMGVMAGLGGGFSFGAFMSLILGTFHLFGTKRAGTTDLGVVQTANLTSSLPRQETLDACVESVEGIKRSKVNRVDAEAGWIDAKGGLTWKTFGDRITFRIELLDTDKFAVSVESRPAVRTTLIDYGKNSENIQTITKALTAREGFARG